MELKGKTAIVTGASRGIGYAVAEALASQGMRLAICARTESELRDAGKRLAKRTEVFAQALDVSDEKGVEAFVKEALKRFGSVEVLVNNAGIAILAPIEETDSKKWDVMMAVNLKGTFLMARAVLPLMKKQKQGYVFNVASVAGKKGLPTASAYGASKFGVVGFTQSLNQEAKSFGVRATAICPGYVATPMTSKAPVPAAEMIRPEDIGKTVLYLLSLTDLVVVQEVVMERTGS